MALADDGGVAVTSKTYTPKSVCQSDKMFGRVQYKYLALTQSQYTAEMSLKNTRIRDVN